MILVTPSFAQWLDHESDFTLEILKRFYDKNENDIDVICACVDGLSPTPDWFPFNGHLHPKEGFSILHGMSASIAPNLWTGKKECIDLENPAPATLTFANAHLSKAVTVPLANTLFKTGKISTLLLSKWQPAKDSFVKIEEDTNRSNVFIRTFQNLQEEDPSFYLPAIPLTPARPIVSGLGNIVRTIDFGNKIPAPASQELEKVVSEYFQVMDIPKSALNVWALIIPQNLLASRGVLPSFQLIDSENAKSLLGAYNGSGSGSGYVGYWITKGATFCRVRMYHPFLLPLHGLASS